MIAALVLGSPKLGPILSIRDVFKSAFVIDCHYFIVMYDVASDSVIVNYTIVTLL